MSIYLCRMRYARSREKISNGQKGILVLFSRDERAIRQDCLVGSSVDIIPLSSDRFDCTSSISRDPSFLGDLTRANSNGFLWKESIFIRCISPSSFVELW